MKTNLIMKYFISCANL